MTILECPDGERREIEDFIAALCRPDRDVVAASRTAIVVAHPDDETIACGAQLPRLRDATIIVVTDGAPRNLVDARKHGFADAEAYAATRADELCRALALADVPVRNVIMLGLSDQTAALRLPELTRTLYHLLVARGIRIALTHVY